MVGTKVWVGNVPTHCEFCRKAIDVVFIDGATSRGPWAFMCVACHAKHGCGLGMGQGQQYEKAYVPDTICNCGALRLHKDTCPSAAMHWVKVKG